jgi:phosphoribosylamine--glycine ligase
MRVCIVGSGAREHTLADVLGRTADEIVVTPGNPGIPGSTPQAPEEIDADLFVIGPEQPLVAGIADRLRARGALVFGPGAAGAQLEGSKAWMKWALVEAGVPSARYATFDATQQDEAIAYLRDLSGFYVVKTDGLAAGKGVFVTESLTDAVDDVREKLSGASFGAAGTRVVIEEGLTGPELSLLCLCDGEHIFPLAPAQDYKRVLDGDRGPNTGGMGAYSPVPQVDEREVGRIVDTIVEPTVAWLRKSDIDYRGVLYAGLMLTPDGPKIIEYNVRFGDPEAQVVLPRITSDLVTALAEVAAGRLRNEPSFADDAMVTVMMCTEGYPVAPRSGDVIEGLERAQAMDDVRVYCAGVARDAKEGLITAGGRVLSVTGRAPDLPAARARAYRAVDVLRWPGVVVRGDIAASPLGL